LIPLGENTNRVEDMKLIAVDCVADPSYPGAFVNGILESKQYVLADDGSYLEELYDKFERKLANLPRKDVEEFLKEQVLDFIRELNAKQ